MKKIPNIILLLESARTVDRDLALGLAKYASLEGPWSFYRETDRKENPLLRLKKMGRSGDCCPCARRKNGQNNH